MHLNGIGKLKHKYNRIYRWSAPHFVSYNKYTRKIVGALVKNGDKMGAWAKIHLLKATIKSNHTIEPYKLLFVAYLKISPVLQPRYVKIAGKMQPIAYGLMSEDKRVTFAIKWAIKLLRDKSKTHTIDIPKLAQSLHAATHNQGELFEYKQQWQRVLLRNTRKMPGQIQRLKTSKIYYG